MGMWTAGAGGPAGYLYAGRQVRDEGPSGAGDPDPASEAAGSSGAARLSRPRVRGHRRDHELFRRDREGQLPSCGGQAPPRPAGGGGLNMTCNEIKDLTVPYLDLDLE